MSDVNVPEWVREIEARLAPFPPMFFGPDKQGNTATITFTPPTHGLLGEYGDAVVRLLGPAIRDLDRLCKEVRDLMAIISDLKEDRSDVFLVYCLDPYLLAKLCHSRHEAEKYAQEAAEEDGRRYVVDVWGGSTVREVSLWGRQGRLCVACEGGREMKDCIRCKGDGLYREKRAED